MKESFLTYISQNSKNNFTNALTKGLANDPEILSDIQRALKTTKDESKQIYELAEKIRINVQDIEILFDRLDEIKHPHSNALLNFIFDIIYGKIDFYEVAKDLIRKHKANSASQSVKQNKLKKVI